MTSSQIKGAISPSPGVVLQQAVQEGCTSISVSQGPISLSFYFDQGRLAYATHSLDVFERLERHLRRLSREFPVLNDKLRSQLRLEFDEIQVGEIPAEYRAIQWLVDEQYLTPVGASQLVGRLVQEVLETFLCFSSDHWVIERQQTHLPQIYCTLDLPRSLELVAKRLQEWQKLGPVIFSPYQCPYLVSQTTAAKIISAEMVQRLGHILKGFNFRQLGALLNQDDLLVAKQFYPLIRNGAVILRDPLAPFDQLPHTYRPLASPSAPLERSPSEAEASRDPETMTQAIAQQAVKTWKIACVDDSQAMLREIERLLEGDEFQVSAINDSMKALMKLASIRPDLILLDVGMPNVDGYQLCTLIRKSSALKEVPVVMVTGHKGLIDRVRARVAGANDYLTKPFSRAELLKMAMRYLL